MKRPRKHVSLKIKLEVALRQLNASDPTGAVEEAGWGRNKVKLKPLLRVLLRALGLDPANVRLDHTPPLALRERAEDGGYIPDELDPRHMQWLSTEDHARKTSGAAEGEGKAHVANSDIHKIRKIDRLTGKVGRNKPKRRWPKGRRLQSRGFEKRKGK